MVSEDGVYEELGLVPDNDVDNPWTRSRSTRSPCSTLTDPVPSFLFPQRPNPNGIPEWGAHISERIQNYEVVTTYAETLSRLLALLVVENLVQAID
ncbi:hypothetical protein V1477_011897 [Vespula maculifrons]|uniref:Uncharacterized protein n=2 Tax=Vespula TaxID=7451 RepID=A0A834JGF7_VESVU|nr:hypothetical protein HZH66_011134 [Vespula vulgaris]